MRATNSSKLTGIYACLDCHLLIDWADGGEGFGRSYFTPVAILLAATYTTYWNGRRGQTPGKAAVALRVTEQFRGEPIGFGRAFVRALPSLLGLWVAISVLRNFQAWPLLVLLVPVIVNMMWPLRDRNRQTWFDKLAGSVVASES